VFVPPRAPQLSPFYFNLGIGYGFESWYAPQGYDSLLSLFREC
jgi:hypothetical protein